MGEDGLFIYFCLIFLVPVIIGIITCTNKKPEPLLPFKIEIKPLQSKKEAKPKIVYKEIIKYVDRPIVAKCTKSAAPRAPKQKKNMTAFNEAKQALMSMGYRAGPVKQLLESIGPCDTAEEYINKALRKI